MEELETVLQGTKPRLLIEEIYSLIDDLFLLPNAAQGVIQDVYQTLMSPVNLEKEKAVSVTLSNE